MDTTTITLAIISSGVLSAIITQIINHLRDIKLEDRQEKKRLFRIKEDVYKEIIKDIDFIYIRTDLLPEYILKKKNNFLQNYRLMFLYSEDEVIKAINNLLDVLVIFPTNDTEEMKKKKNKIACGMIALRKQIVIKTKLTEKDFQHIT